MFITIVATLLVLGLVIFIHELGHFAVAKRSGIRVEQFSLGFPPKMIGKKIGETEYCISWLPLGGYVKIAGQSDLGEAEIKGEPWEFASKPIFTKIAVIAAGPLMNFLLAFFIFSALTLGWGIPAYNTTRIGEVLENSPAEAVGIEVGDRIISIEDQRVQNWAQIQRAITLNRGKTFQIKLERGNEVKTLVVTLQPEDEILGISPFIEPVVGRVEKGSPAQRAGIRQGDVITAINGKQVTQWRDVVDEIYSHPGESITVEWRRDGEYYKDTVITQMKKQYDAQNRVVEYGAIGISAGFTTKKVGPLQAIHYGIKQTWERIYLILRVIRGLVVGQISPRLLGGPILIAQMAGETVQWGWKELFGFAAFLSINLGLINLIPIPIVDGGVILFLLIEGAIRRPIPKNVRLATTKVGLAIIILLMVYVTFNDITRLLH